MPCRIVFARPEDLGTYQNYNNLIFRFLTIVRSSLFFPMAAWIFLRFFSMVCGPCTKCSITIGSISSQTPQAVVSYNVSHSYIYPYRDIGMSGSHCMKRPPVSKACVLFSSSSVRSMVHRHTEIWKCQGSASVLSLIKEICCNLSKFSSVCKTALACAILERLSGFKPLS